MFVIVFFENFQEIVLIVLQLEDLTSFEKSPTLEMNDEWNVVLLLIFI